MDWKEKIIEKARKKYKKIYPPRASKKLENCFIDIKGKRFFYFKTKDKKRHFIAIDDIERRIPCADNRNDKQVNNAMKSTTFIDLINKPISFETFLKLMVTPVSYKAFFDVIDRPGSCEAFFEVIQKPISMGNFFEVINTPISLNIFKTVKSSKKVVYTS